MNNNYDKSTQFMLIILLIITQTIRKRQEYLVQEQQEIISNMIFQIDHQQTWDHLSMWDYQMDKPCNQEQHID